MSLYVKSRVSNLWRNTQSGVYYARVTVRGKGVWRSLDTDLESIAKLKLPRTLAEIRAAAGRLKGGKLTLGECAAIYLAGKKQQKDIKPRAKEYRESTLVGIRQTWPEFDGIKAVTVTPEAAGVWWKRAKLRYSPSRANGMLQSLRGILQEAVSAGALESNPVSKLNCKQVSVVAEDVSVLSFGQMELLFAELKRQRSGAYWLCRFLYLFTLRVNTARCLTPAMVNRERKQFVIPAELVKRGKPGRLVYAPIFPEMEVLLDEMDGQFGRERACVLPIKGCLRTLARVCVRLKLPVQDHHAFRHIFTSHAIYKGIDVRTLAGWRNDRDNGAFLLKHYSHIIDTVSAEKAASLYLRNGPAERIHVLEVNDGQ